MEDRRDDGGVLVTHILIFSGVSTSTSSPLALEMDKKCQLDAKEGRPPSACETYNLDERGSFSGSATNFRFRKIRVGLCWPRSVDTI